MNNRTLEKIRAELESVLVGQRFGKIFPLSRASLAIDFRLIESQFLLISVEPSAPRVYLIKRRLRDLEKQALNPPAFVLFLRKRLAGARLLAVRKMDGERILFFDLAAETELGEHQEHTLTLQLTGRSANLFLLDHNQIILDKWRETFGPGQEVGDRYAPPTREGAARPKDEDAFPIDGFATLSDALDHFYLEKETENRFQNRARAAANKLKQELARREKLDKKLNQDLAQHGDAEKWKRFGDLILANLATARREGGKILVTDFYDENLPVIAIEADENLPPTAVAERYFKKYTKARNAQEEISKRLSQIETELADLRRQNEKLQQAIEERDEQFLLDFLGESAEQIPGRQKVKQAENLSGARRFFSSDGFEILVGKGARDNDTLTFRAAKSLDLWLHAADYPGSHVIVRNPNRQEIPPRTLLEAAQIAAFYSQARSQPKVAVHYTPKKFVNKPKGGAPGLVSLASFKTILVEPKVKES